MVSSTPTATELLPSREDRDHFSSLTDLLERLFFFFSLVPTLRKCWLGRPPRVNVAKTALARGGALWMIAVVRFLAAIPHSLSSVDIVFPAHRSPFTPVPADVARASLDMGRPSQRQRT